MEEYMLPCLNKQLFGFDCMGCGAQRALLLVFQGEFASAFHMYPAVYSILGLLGFLVADLFLKLKQARAIKLGLVFLNLAIIVVAYFYRLHRIFN